jgi:hypothetical protein
MVVKVGKEGRQMRDARRGSRIAECAREERSGTTGGNVEDHVHLLEQITGWKPEDGTRFGTVSRGTAAGAAPSPFASTTNRQQHQQRPQ